VRQAGTSRGGPPGMTSSRNGSPAAQQLPAQGPTAAAHPTSSTMLTTGAAARVRARIDVGLIVQQHNAEACVHGPYSGSPPAPICC